MSVLAFARHAKHWWYQKKLFQEWLQAQRLVRTRIHPSLEVRGLFPPYSHLQIGHNCEIENCVTFWLSPSEEACPELHIGDDVFIGQNAYLGVYEPVTIGRFSQIGAYSYITSANHRFERRDVPIVQQGFTGAPIVIEDDVWLGTHVVVLPGVTIGRGAIVAAGSVVNKDVPPYEVWGGAPARFLKHRPD